MSTPAAIDVEGVVATARDTMNVRRVFGDPVEHDGLTIIPAARVRGGGGGGGGTGPDGEGGTGSGAGFGVTARPAGAFVVRDGDIQWRPAIDVDRVVLAGLAFGALVVLVARGLIVGWRRG